MYRLLQEFWLPVLRKHARGGERWSRNRCYLLLQADKYFAVTYFHDTFHDHYKLFTFVRGEYEITVFRSSYIDNKRLHVAVRFRLGQGMIFHVLTALDSIIGEADAVFGFRLAANGRTRFILIVKESS